MRVGCARPPPFTLCTITYKVALYDPAERADTLPLFNLYPYVLLLVLASRVMFGSALLSPWGEGGIFSVPMAFTACRDY